MNLFSKRTEESRLPNTGRRDSEQTTLSLIARGASTWVPDRHVLTWSRPLRLAHCGVQCRVLRCRVRVRLSRSASSG